MKILKSLPTSYSIYKAKCDGEVEVFDKRHPAHWMLRTRSGGNKTSLVDQTERLYVCAKQHGFDYEVHLSTAKANLDRDSYLNKLSYLFILPSGVRCQVKSQDFTQFEVLNIENDALLAVYQKNKHGMHFHKHDSLKLYGELTDHDKLLLIMMGRIERQTKPQQSHLKQLLTASSSNGSLASITSLTSKHSHNPEKSAFRDKLLHL
ncbi:hypothetical protein E3Q22_03570 [Wallemia mellicola]|uniref:Uncharacterized protein n=1 Tax=Wallemia mellicola TaxID=1708541 RepID=A0A4T0N2Q7_9BASI|nr:hypothetical protein E3Q23_03403 [Wallemia mellicola]TIB73819.1 hypothetical protein E3Q24_00963 [Wallemia mellicola]TIB76406.1 hypothetical protein E3Q22_03570 [Wallemia mellicola]TIB82261.1 hypothetical protein E3Q21_03476 [Wallemia mellicola]TIB84982.1 hypothetical protein E3Q20_03431 [Wallemia mellicola]